MILVDANLLIYAVNQDAPLNRKAKPWLESVLSGKETVGLPWNVLLAFLRLTTRPGLFRHPLPMDTAFDLVASWLDHSPATIVTRSAPPSDSRRVAPASGHRRKSTTELTRLRWPSNTQRNSVPPNRLCPVPWRTGAILWREGAAL